MDDYTSPERVESRWKGHVWVMLGEIRTGIYAIGFLLFCVLLALFYIASKMH